MSPFQLVSSIVGLFGIFGGFGFVILIVRTLIQGEEQLGRAIVRGVRSGMHAMSMRWSPRDLAPPSFRGAQPEAAPAPPPSKKAATFVRQDSVDVDYDLATFSHPIKVPTPIKVPSLNVPPAAASESPTVVTPSAGLLDKNQESFRND